MTANTETLLVPRRPGLALTVVSTAAAVGFAAVAAIASAAGPAFAETSPMRASKPAAPAAHAGPPSAPASAPAAGMLRGKVLETMNASNYTYARVETPDGEQWLAGPQTAMKVGDLIAWPGGAPMNDFQSKTLGRTFDTILFVGQFVVGGGTGSDAMAAPHGALSGKGAEGPEVTGIARAAGGLTVAEIYDRRAELEGKEVTLRGKVVKFNSGVMDRNWLHLRDGSHGKNGESDLTVTSDADAAVGNVVVVKGKLVLNKDFGFNYKYDVMLEGAKVTVE